MRKVIVKFENPSHGKMKKESNKEISRKHPGGTVIEKVSVPYSLSKSKQGNISSAKVIQFPVKLTIFRKTQSRNPGRLKST